MWLKISDFVVVYRPQANWNFIIFISNKKSDNIRDIIAFRWESAVARGDLCKPLELDGELGSESGVAIL